MKYVCPKLGKRYLECEQHDDDGNNAENKKDIPYLIPHFVP
jgi:hypothetical protein